MPEPGRHDGVLGRWLPVAGWAALIAVLSSSWFGGEHTGRFLLPVLAALFPGASHAQLVAIHHGIRKLAHFGEYLVLGVLLLRALRIPGRPLWRAAVGAVGLAALWSIADEVHQAFVPGRGAAAADCLIDVGGAAAGVGLAALRRGLRPAASPSAPAASRGAARSPSARG